MLAQENLNSLSNLFSNFSWTWRSWSGIWGVLDETSEWRIWNGAFNEIKLRKPSRKMEFGSTKQKHQNTQQLPCYPLYEVPLYCTSWSYDCPQYWLGSLERGTQVNVGRPLVPIDKYWRHSGWWIPPHSPFTVLGGQNSLRRAESRIRGQPVTRKKRAPRPWHGSLQPHLRESFNTPKSS